jgi:hypothetical protein
VCGSCQPERTSASHLLLKARPPHRHPAVKPAPPQLRRQLSVGLQPFPQHVLPQTSQPSSTLAEAQACKRPHCCRQLSVSEALAGRHVFESSSLGSGFLLQGGHQYRCMVLHRVRRENAVHACTEKACGTRAPARGGRSLSAQNCSAATEEAPSFGTQRPSSRMFSSREPPSL